MSDPGSRRAPRSLRRPRHHREVRLPAGAPHAEWLRLRSEGIGASEIGMALGVSDWGGPLALWHRKRFPEP